MLYETFCLVIIFYYTSPTQNILSYNESPREVITYNNVGQDVVILLHDYPTNREETDFLKFYSVYIGQNNIQDLNLLDELQTVIYSEVIGLSELLIFEIKLQTFKDCIISKNYYSSTGREKINKNIVIEILSCESKITKRVNLTGKLSALNYNNNSHPSFIELNGFLKIDKEDRIKTNTYQDNNFNEEGILCSFSIQIHLYGDWSFNLLNHRVSSISSSDSIGVLNLETTSL